MEAVMVSVTRRTLCTRMWRPAVSCVPRPGRAMAEGPSLVCNALSNCPTVSAVGRTTSPPGGPIRTVTVVVRPTAAVAASRARSVGRAPAPEPDAGNRMAQKGPSDAAAARPAESVVKDAVDVDVVEVAPARGSGEG